MGRHRFLSNRQNGLFNCGFCLIADRVVLKKCLILLKDICSYQKALHCYFYYVIRFLSELQTGLFIELTKKEKHVLRQCYIIKDIVCSVIQPVCTYIVYFLFAGTLSWLMVYCLHSKLIYVVIFTDSPKPVS